MNDKSTNKTPLQSRSKKTVPKERSSTNKTPQRSSADTRIIRKRASVRGASTEAKPAQKSTQRPTGASSSGKSSARPEQSQVIRRKRAAARNVSREQDIILTRGPEMTPPKKKRRKMSRAKKNAILCILILLAVAIAFLARQILGNLNKDLSSSSTRAAFGISDEAASMAKEHRIVNVLVFGIDGRESIDTDRTDTMIIATADYEHGSIKLTSLMRDTLAWIEDEDCFDKLNVAYNLGGANSSIKAVNQNFDTAITDYVTVNFDCMIEMVNAVGGVEITISDEDELYWTNDYLREYNVDSHTNSPLLTSTGTQTVDGVQALSYCRVRYAGNADFDRTQRQRNVFEQVISKALALNPFAQYRLMMKVLPYVKTSLSVNEMVKYAANVLLMKEKAISQMRLPTDKDCQCGYLDDVSYVFPDTLEDNIKALYRFIYETDYTPSPTARDISNRIDNLW